MSAIPAVLLQLSHVLLDSMLMGSLRLVSRAGDGHQPRVDEDLSRSTNVNSAITDLSSSPFPSAINRRY